MDKFEALTIANHAHGITKGRIASYMDVLDFLAPIGRLLPECKARIPISVRSTIQIHLRPSGFVQPDYLD